MGTSPENTYVMSENKKKREARHEQYVEKQGNRVVNYIVAALVVLCLLGIAMAMLF